MIKIGSGELCEFNYEDNLDGYSYCDSEGLYRQLESEVGRAFFGGNFSRNMNHRLLGSITLYRTKLSGIRYVLNPSGLPNCTFDKPCYELLLKGRVEKKQDELIFYTPTDSRLIMGLAEEYGINYIEQLLEILQSKNVECITGIILPDNYFKKVTINPRKENTDEKIRENHKITPTEQRVIQGITNSKNLEKILASIRNNKIECS